MKSFDPHSANAEYIDQLYERYLSDPDSLESEWIAFFKGFEFGFARLDEEEGDGEEEAGERELRPERPADKGVYALVQAYRQLGHFTAHLDPLGYSQETHPLLELSEFGLGKEDMRKTVGSGGFLGDTDGTLHDLLVKLKTTYCRTLGVEYMSIADKEQRDWLQERIEPKLNRTECSEEECRSILTRLIEAEEFEQFLHTRYIGQKRFSLEGGESLLPLLDILVVRGADLGVDELVIGMAHRGRLNVLAHLMRKPYEVILSEFEGVAQSERSDDEGDVKYHMGYSYDCVTEEGHKVHLSLSPNPSHLELVDPVIEGQVYAKQDYLHDRERTRVVPVLIHGEAAFTGQGIIAETLNLSQLQGYHTGGTIHIIINNQLGYTATPHETRFTPYPTDVARQIQAPVFHVNADDPEAVVQAARLAIEFREAFKRDVLIDLWCYRRYGHNEADDPTLTQPLMYQQIEKHPSVFDLYSFQLAAQNKIDQEEIDAIRSRVRLKLEGAQEIARKLQVRPHAPVFGGVWQGLTWATGDWSAHTAIDRKRLQSLVEAATRIPDGFRPHRTVQRLVRARQGMAAGEQPFDWGGAEMAAFASLLMEGVPVRLAGQDSQRGTFAHRHAVWHDIETGEQHVPLAHLSRDQGEFEVRNTMLSELAVLGFEYGVSTADPRRLVLWEAQFGDFANGAQMIIDQFLASGEAKWQKMCGMVLLLPHGYEGMGPEHSSARLERFLELCAKKNMQVVYPTTPAQLFHVLRRQMHRNFRKPLVLMTPKSMLRNKLCVSSLEAFTDGDFQTVIDDAELEKPEEVRRVLISSGKVFYDLLEGRRERKQQGTALVRVEQLYPLPQAEIRGILERYPQAEEFFWVQEEAQNMGAWSFIRPLLERLLPDEKELRYVGRDEAASPATGSHEVHAAEQQEIVEKSLDMREHEVILTTVDGNSGRHQAEG